MEKFWGFAIFGILIALLLLSWYHENFVGVSAFSFFIGCCVGAIAQYNLMVDFLGKDSIGRKERKEKD